MKIMIAIRNKKVKRIILKDLNNKAIEINDINSDIYSETPCGCIRTISNGKIEIKSKKDFGLDIYPNNKEDFYDNNIPKIFKKEIEIEYENGEIKIEEIDNMSMIDNNGKIRIEKRIII